MNWELQRALLNKESAIERYDKVAREALFVMMNGAPTDVKDRIMRDLRDCIAVRGAYRGMDDGEATEDATG